MAFFRSLFGASLRNRITKRTTVRRHTSLGFEALEDRRLLAVILWTNRGVNGGADTDGFAATYGGLVEEARAIVDRAIDDWESAIIDFNYLGAFGGVGQPVADNTFQLQIDSIDLGGGGRGRAFNTLFDNQGKPFSSQIEMDDDGGSNGWFFDVTPGDDSEFIDIESQYRASFTGIGGASDDNDFYRTILHEIGHSLGITNNAAAAIQSFLTDSGFDDVNDAGADLLTFNGAGGQVTLTTNGGLHIYEGIGVGGLPVHPNELMNPGRTVSPPPTTRLLISELSLQVLSDAYGYQVLDSLALPAFISPDAFEQNDTLATATILGSEPTITLRDLTIHDADDEDFFKITAHDTGKLIINAFFDDAAGDIDIEVQDSFGNTIDSSLSFTDDEQIIIPVVGQEMYFLRVFGAGNAINTYDLEIENFAAPIPDVVVLDPNDDSGISSQDAITFASNPTVFVQADLFDFNAMGIDILSAAQANAGVTPGAAVEVFVNGVRSGFADLIAGTGNTLFTFDVPTADLTDGTPANFILPGGFLNFVTAAVRIFDGQQNIFGTPTPAEGRTQLSDPLLLVHGDVEGPRVTNLQVTGSPGYELFNPKPADGPTPLVNSLTVTITDGPNRLAASLHAALGANANAPGNYLVVGDANGVIPILAVNVVNNPRFAGLPATATIKLTFAAPLPDDRFTLTILDEVRDFAGNRLDGESDAASPGAPDFSANGSGNGTPGGDFVSRFTVDSRAEIGTWSAGSIYLDTNGNFTFDPQNLDAVNRDIVHTLGFTTDAIFAGNFGNVANPADGFDKLAAYGTVSSTYRFLIDLTNDGVADISVNQTSGAGTPIAGNFDGNAANGDEVGLFNGNAWQFDTTGNFVLGAPITTTIFGLPFAGDFDGNGSEDIGTYNATTNEFSILLNPNFAGPLGGALTTFKLGDGFPFTGVRDRPVAADMNGDGFDDIGLWVPDRSGVPPEESAEWYWLLSGVNNQGAPTSVLDRIGPDLTLPGTNVINFTPVPFGGDLFAQFGDEFAVPIVGNFDPPTVASGSEPPEPQVVIEGDYNNSGTVDQGDYITWRSAFGATVVPGSVADGNGNGLIDAGDYSVWLDRLGTTAPAAATSDNTISANTNAEQVLDEETANDLENIVNVVEVQSAPQSESVATLSAPEYYDAIVDSPESAVQFVSEAFQLAAKEALAEELDYRSFATRPASNHDLAIESLVSFLFIPRAERIAQGPQRVADRDQEVGHLRLPAAQEYFSQEYFVQEFESEVDRTLQRLSLLEAVLHDRLEPDENLFNEKEWHLAWENAIASTFAG